MLFSVIALSWSRSSSFNTSVVYGAFTFFPLASLPKVSFWFLLLCCWSVSSAFDLELWLIAWTLLLWLLLKLLTLSASLTSHLLFVLLLLLSILLSFSKAYKSKTAAAESYYATVVLDKVLLLCLALLFVLERSDVFLLSARCGTEEEAGINAVHDFVVSTHFCIAIVFIANT